MAFEVPHKHDISLDGQDMRNQMIENFKAIEQALSDEVTDRKKGDGNLQGQIDELQERCQKLEDDKATHDEVKQVSQEWNKRTSHIARGTDIPTTRAVVLRILAEIGQVDLSKLPELDDDVVTKKEFDKLINDLDQNGNNVSVPSSDLYSWLENYTGGGV